MHTTESLFALPVFDVRLKGMAFDSNGESLLTVDAAGRACHWDATTGELLDATPRNGRTSAVAFDDELKIFALGSAEAQPAIRIFDAATLAKIRSWRLPEHALPATTSNIRVIIQLDFSEDGKTLAAMVGLEVVSVWEVATGELVHSFSVQDGVGGIVFDAVNNEVVTMDLFAGTALKFRDVRTGEILRELGGHGVLSSLSSFSSRVCSVSRGRRADARSELRSLMSAAVRPVRSHRRPDPGGGARGGSARPRATSAESSEETTTARVVAR